MRFNRVHIPATNDDGTRAWVQDIEGNITRIPRYRELWSRFNREWLENLFQVITSYYKSAQYDQVPSMGELAYFLMDNVPRWTSHQVQFFWVGVDAANTATAAGSETALVALGIQGPILKVLDARSGKWRTDEMVPQIESFCADVHRHTGAPMERLLVERAAGGYQILDRIPGAEPISPLGSKEDRAGDVAYLVNRGQVQFPAKPTQGVAKLEQQLRDFPLCSLKDLVDSFVHCLKFTQGTSEMRHHKDETSILLLSDPIEEIFNGQHDGPSEAFRHGPFEENEW